MTMTSDAKRELSKTIRELRERLLTDLQAAAESTYRLSLKIGSSGLAEAERVKRQRLEDWVDEQARALPAKQREEGKKRFWHEVVKQAAYTLLNRLVYLRLLEAMELRKPPVVSQGWESRGYKDFRELAGALVRDDESEGYAYLLKLIFDDLAVDLPGLYGPAGMAELIPVPSSTLRAVVEALDDDELESCWTDDMTLGWIYQYWNDPEREALDAKLNSGGKVEPHEIASKTQMFTERYMVDWLLQNSLGPMWLAMCRKHGWTPMAESSGTLDALEERRKEWREKRDKGEVELTELMPLHNEVERRWAYYVPQPIPQDAIDKAPSSIRDIKILDPACGSGHFLVVAMDLLAALYREEAQHRGEEGQEQWSDRAIVESILENNLHGIDLDPRAVQIAVAALWLKAQQLCPDARPRRLNLVASNLRLASLPDDDPALIELKKKIEDETGIPGTLTDTVVHALKGADHLGSLLKVDAAVDEAIRSHELELSRHSGKMDQGDLYKGYAPRQRELISAEQARVSMLDLLERFLDEHTGGDDLGLRLRGEQLAAGVRFVRLIEEGRYDLVVGNPPYQGTSKMADPSYVQKQYPRGKADLYAAFLERGLQLVREGGVSALLTMRNWMFIKQYSELRQWLLESYDLRALGDIGTGAFTERNMDSVISSAMAVCRNAEATGERVVVAQAGDPQEQRFDTEKTLRRAAALQCQVGRFEFEPEALKVVPEWPVVYWWRDPELSLFESFPELGSVSPARKGLDTGDNTRFVRFAWEHIPSGASYVPFFQGGKSRQWIEPHLFSVEWKNHGLQIRLSAETSTGANIRNDRYYFQRGIAFTLIGAEFRARVHGYPSVIAGKGSSLFPPDLDEMVCRLNSRKSKQIMGALNPGIGFEIGDLNRLPLFPVCDPTTVCRELDSAFLEHESHREPSVEFKRPGPSPWRYAQEWAQSAVDRPGGDPLTPYEPQYDPEPATDHLSFALGVALGRFGGGGEGILDPTKDSLEHALPAGILFLDGTLESGDDRDSLGHPACKILHDTWATKGQEIDAKSNLRDYLATKFFADVHRKMYENRPIHWPLSSSKKTFVAWVTIHRWDERTLSELLAEHLYPAFKRLTGEIDDLNKARSGVDKKAARAAERRYAVVQKAREELQAFISDVEQCAEKGPPPTDAKCPAREVDARYAPDLDDGVMINSSALCPLLEPQWKDPKKWFKELCTAKGRKDYDWSHLAMRYWPTRVDEKCQKDPSLGVAHGCFWRYHPERAYAWELRLQDEIAPDFLIEETDYRGSGDHKVHRAAFLKAHPDQAREIEEKEQKRRDRKDKKKAQGELDLGGGNGEDEDADLESREHERSDELETSP